MDFTFTFHHRNQSPNKSILKYTMELAIHCKFGTYLDQALIDQLVCGLRSENIQKRLLTEVDLTLSGTDKLAQMMEAPNQYTELMKIKPEGTISKVSHNQKSVGNSGKWEQFI